MRARFLFLKKFSTVPVTVEHRTPPKIVAQRVGGQWTYFRRPAGVRPVKIYSACFYDPSKVYRGRLGAKDKARLARALAGA